jgi:integrase
LDALWAELKQDGSIESHALRFLILTALLVSTVRYATWGEIKLELCERDDEDELAAVPYWSIPGRRMKMRKPLTVSLSPQAVEILRAVEGR